METLCQNEITTLPSKTLESKIDYDNKPSTNATQNQSENEKETPIIKIGRVYLITNLVNNKKYVGVTKRELQDRWEEHIYKSKKDCPWLINKAIRKHGHNNFKMELIEECHNITERDLLLKESAYIVKYDTFVENRRGYNLVKYDDNKFFASEETKKKRSRSLTGEKNPRYGKHLTEETKQKLSLAQKGKFAGKDNPFYGKHHTEATLKKFKERKIIYFGKRHHNYDFTIRKFRNTKTGEEFLGNRHEFAEKYKLDKRNIKVLLLKRTKMLKDGWIVCEA